jgi:glycosyltransferase involved in cell wall biosynthesis
MKNVLFFITSLSGGGAEKVLINLVNNLDRTKYKITVQTLFDIGINRKYLKDDVKYIPGFRKQISGNVILMKLFSPKTLYKMFIKEKYDIIVSYLEGPPARIISGCTSSHTKKICWIHVEQHTLKAASHSFRSIKEANLCYSGYNQIVCVAETVKKDFDSIFKLNVPTKVLYNSNEDKVIRSFAEEEISSSIFSSDSINIISVGRLTDAKGYDRLINVHQKLINEGIKHHIYVLGIGPDEKKLRNQARLCGVSDTFHFLGFEENPYKFISKADMFVCSSRREGFSTAVTEALILGIPVISTECSGALELLGENNEYGIVTENSENGIYLGLKQMITDPGLLQHYKKQASERGKKFSIQKTINAVEDMLDNLE